MSETVERVEVDVEFSKEWRGLEVQFGRIRGTGEAAAMRNDEPLFLIVRPSYEECINRAEAAIAFYREQSPTPETNR